MGLTLYHGTDVPDLDEKEIDFNKGEDLALGRGLYLALTPDHASNYGKYVYEIEVDFDGDIKDIPEIPSFENLETFDRILERDYEYDWNEEVYRHKADPDITYTEEEIYDRYMDDANRMRKEQLEKGNPLVRQMNQVVVYDKGVIIDVELYSVDGSYMKAIEELRDGSAKGRGKSGWFGQPSRHSLASKGYMTRWKDR